jgi:hypothetical protein
VFANVTKVRILSAGFSFGGMPLENAAAPGFTLQVLVARGAPLWALRCNPLPKSRLTFEILKQIRLSVTMYFAYFEQNPETNK